MGNIITSITNFLWSWPLIAIIIFVSLAYSFDLKFMQIRKFGFIMKNTFGKIFEKSSGAEGTVTPFQAVATALSATLGVGNIAGVGVAIGLGGPGAIFWMWIVTFVAMISKYGEITLAVKYREQDENGEYHGGPMHYIKKGLGKNRKSAAGVAMLWSIIFSVMMFIGGFVQANAVADVVYESFGVSKLVCGIVLAAIVGIVILGGIKTIGKFAEKVIPIMAVTYMIGCLVVIGLNAEHIGTAFLMIFKGAFGGTQAIGGFAGSTVTLALSNGFARGIYSNESGMGTAPVAHSSAMTNYPAKQGLWGIFEAFISTMIVCTMTALAVLVSGSFTTGKVGAALTAHAFKSSIGGRGDLVVTVCVILFAFTTALVDGYYSETGFAYITGTTKYLKPFRILYVIGIIVGAVGGLQTIWGLFDFFMAIEVIINLYVIFRLRKDVVEETNKYFNSEEVTGNNSEQLSDAC